MGDDTPRISASLCDHAWQYYRSEKANHYSYHSRDDYGDVTGYRYCPRCHRWQKKGWNHFIPEGSKGGGQSVESGSVRSGADSAGINRTRSEAEQNADQQFANCIALARAALE